MTRRGAGADDLQRIGSQQFHQALLDAVPQLQHIFVRGEISNYKLYPSGHHYFTLKDEGSALKCVMFRGMAGKLRFRRKTA